MEKLPLISVAMCTYNAGNFLEKQIFSILEQSHQNIEIVVVDDDSTDGTYEYLEKLKETHQQIKLFRNDINLGFNKNFEKAISLCSGDLIAISDQDDIWLPDKLEVLMNNIGDNWLVFSNSELIDSEEKLLGIQILKPNFSMENKSFKSILLRNSVTGHTCLFTKEFREYFLPIPAEGYYDWWIGFIAFYHQKATYVNKCLTLHRMHNTSVIGKAYADKKTTRKALQKELSTQLSLMKAYKNLTADDKNFIKKISAAYDKHMSLYLAKLIAVNYKSYFPDLKERNFLSKFIFAIKFSSKQI